MKKKDFRIKLLSILLVSIFLLSACAAEVGKSSNGQEKITLMLDWYPNAVHSALYIAEENGIFEKNNLDVEILMPAETNDPLKLVAADKVNFALTNQISLISARSMEIPVIAVGDFVANPLTKIMVLKNGEIQDIKDFEGKTLGYSLPVYEKIAKSTLENAGLDLEKVEFMDIGWDLIPALSTGEVAGTCGAFINHEALMMEKEGQELKYFDTKDFEVPGYSELVLATNEKFALENKETIKAFVDSLIEAQEYVLNNKSESLNILIENQNEIFPLDREIEIASLDILIPLMNNFMENDQEKYQELSEWMLKVKLIDTIPDIKVYIQD